MTAMTCGWMSNAAMETEQCSYTISRPVMLDRRAEECTQLSKRRAPYIPAERANMETQTSLAETGAQQRTGTDQEKIIPTGKWERISPEIGKYTEDLKRQTKERDASSKQHPMKWTHD